MDNFRTLNEIVADLRKQYPTFIEFQLATLATQIQLNEIVANGLGVSLTSNPFLGSIYEQLDDPGEIIRLLKEIDKNIKTE